MWWILQVVGALAVTVSLVSSRILGFGYKSWIIYSLIAISISFYAFGKSYASAPTFTGAWFVGQTALNVFGLVAGILWFNDILTTKQWVGIIISMVGGYLLI